MEPRHEGLALSVVDVVKTYGNIRALDGVTIGVRPGEFVGLLGPNGAGKTTLFQVLTGLYVPDAGTIEVDGHNIRENAVPALGSLGIVFQSPTLAPVPIRYQAKAGQGNFRDQALRPGGR